jgi:hypothetical protein
VIGGTVVRSTSRLRALDLASGIAGGRVASTRQAGAGDGGMTSVTGRVRARPAVEHVLAAVHAVVGLAAVVGGIGLVRNGLGMPEEWLLSTPFDTWLIPGVLLALGVGGSQLLAAVLLAAHDPQARSASMVAGIGLATWIVVQSVLLHRYHPFSPALFALGVSTAVVAGRCVSRVATG